jgi:TRAP-type C4-dicarboxylate transport system substrate-binding protein
MLRMDKKFNLLLLALFLIAVFTGSAWAQGSPKFNLTLAHTYSANDVRGETATYWANLVEKKTEGKVKVRIHPGGELVGGRELFGATASGAIDASLVSSSYITGEVPQVEAFVLPLLPPAVTNQDYWNAWRNHKDFWSSVIEKKGVKPLLAFPLGAFAVLVSKVPVHQAADLKGLKVRTAGGKILPKSVELFGASAVRIAAAELYPALQRGTIDACLTANETYVVESLYEVASYVTQCRWYNSVYFIMINPSVWNKLGPELQGMILKSSEEAEKWGGDRSEEEARKAIQECKKKAKEYYVLPSEEQMKWFKMAEPLWKKWAAGIPQGEKLLDMFLK